MIGRQNHSSTTEASGKGHHGTRFSHENIADVSALMIFLGILNQQAMDNMNSAAMNGMPSDPLSEADILVSRLLDDAGQGGGEAVEKLLERIRKLLSGSADTVTARDIHKEFDALFSALMDSGSAAAPTTMDDTVTQLTDQKEAGSASQDNQAAFSAGSGQSEGVSAFAGNGNSNTLTEQGKATADVVAAQSGNMQEQADAQGAALQTGKPLAEQQAADSAREGSKAEAMAAHHREAAMMEKTGTDSAASQSTYAMKPGENVQEKNGKEGSRLSASDITPRQFKDNASSRAEGSGQDIGQPTDTSVRLSSPGSDLADNDTAGKQHREPAHVMDFRLGMNHDAAHRGVNAQTTQENSGQTVFHVAGPDSSTVRSASMSADSAKSSAVSDQVREGVMDQVGHGIRTAVAMNRNRAVIHLNPPELGSVTIRLHVGHNNSVHASFLAEHAHTRQLLESGMETLRTQLSQNGFDMGQVNVNLSGGGMHDSGMFRREGAEGGRKGFENIFKQDESDTDLNASIIRPGTSGQGKGVHIIM